MMIIRTAFLLLAVMLSFSPANAQTGSGEVQTTQRLSAVVPELVGEGVISTPLHEFSPAVSPDGKYLYYTVTDGPFSRMTLVRSRRQDDAWAEPEVLEFSGVWNDGDLAIAPDGGRLFFISNRPASGQTPKSDLDLWYVDRDARGGWGTPVKLPDSINSDTNEVYPSVATDGTLYFGRSRVIYRSRLVNGQYQPPEKLPLEGFSFAIAPGQSFAIIGRPGAAESDIDMFLIEQTKDGWSAPVRLPDGVNTQPANDLAGSISADGKTLWFVSQRRDPAPITWPRRRTVTKYSQVRAELGGAYSGLRNIFRIPVESVRH